MKKYQKPVRTSLDLAEVSATYRPKIKVLEQPKLSSSLDAFDYLRTIWNEDTMEYTESAYMLIMNRANHVIGWALISQGGTAGTAVDPKMIFQNALLFNAAFIILAHNHPSGNLQPSSSDISLTKRLVDLGKMMDMPLVDHIIMTANGYYSFMDQGLF